MELIQQAPDVSAYLAADEAIDHGHPLVRETAARLRSETEDAYTYAAAAFEFVRDTIIHSADSGDTRVTWRASDVLATRNGICHAKSHALVALRLPGRGRWDRQDPRGNRPGVDTRFSLDGERLAWPVRPEFNEMDYPVLYVAPHPAVLHGLRAAVDRAQLWRTLPAAL
ncbi:transglutaminase family protein [Streptomyces sp. NPDC058221]|uniref:transglutaminase-like domain-containing protein n=1 Tax=Streptomyces sp. NPDC058221 TaxID=3346388 RepID=UPI0036E72951